MARHGMSLHVTPTNFAFASRIERITEYLQQRKLFSSVEAIGIAEANEPALETRADGRVFRRIKVRVGLRTHSRVARALDFLIWYSQVLLYYGRARIACVHAHTVSVLPLCWLISVLHRSALVYEPHEMESETGMATATSKAIIRAIERTFSRRAAAVVTVSPGIADWYADNLGIRHPWSVRNLPDRPSFEPLPPHYYARRFGFAEDDLVFLYQGLIDEGRGIQLLIDAFKLAGPDRHVVFLGFGSLVGMVEQAASDHPNIHFHPAVPSKELLRYTAAADVGLLMIEPISLSYKYCYPNKYCESLTAHIPVIFTESLWLRTEVEQFDCGWDAALDSKALAQIVQQVTRQSIAEKTEGARAWARANTWEQEKKILDRIYEPFCAREPGATA